MLTRLRVDMAGQHHVINRSDVFRHRDDKEMFVQIIDKAATLLAIKL